jgi:hypothetical protein
MDAGRIEVIGSRCPVFGRLAPELKGFAFGLSLGQEGSELGETTRARHAKLRSAMHRLRFFNEVDGD